MIQISLRRRNKPRRHGTWIAEGTAIVSGIWASGGHFLPSFFVFLRCGAGRVRRVSVPAGNGLPQI
jgi:hypothetical protein